MSIIAHATVAPDHRVPVSVVAELVDDLTDRTLVDPAAGLDGMAALLVGIDRLVAMAVTVLIGVEHRQVIAAEGLTTSSWLRGVAGRTGADAGMLVAAADRLAHMPATLAAFQRGVLSWGTVRGIVTAARSLTAPQRGWLDATLTSDEARLGRVDPDTLVADAQALADRCRPDLQRDRANRAAAAQHLVLQPGVDGTGSLYGTLDAETFAAVTAAIDGITRDGHGRRVASNVEALRALARQRVTLTRDSTDDADGATDGAAADGDGASDASTTVRPAPSTARPEVVVVTDVRLLTPDADLLGSGVARLLWRQDRPAPHLTPHAVRRLSCDATIRPVLVDGDRILGTAEPYAAISKAIRTALAARDGACRFPACHAPVDVCDAHHLVHRADGGPTTLPNLALLCCAHHRAVHEGGWQPTLDVTTGAMTFTRRGVTLHSEPRLPHDPPGTVTTGTPPMGRPGRRPPDRSDRGDGHPPDEPAPAPATAPALPLEPLPF